MTVETLAPPTLPDVLAALAAERQEKERLESALALLRADALSQFEETWRDKLDRLAELKGQVETLEKTTRELALAEYQATGKKSPCQGVTIRVSKRVQYDDDEAIAWAKVHGHNYLVSEVLDTQAFNKVAQAMPLPFVTYTEVPSVAISTRLVLVEGSDGGGSPSD